ncbi:MAG: glycine betaine ABC transporter substrate-binding protein [Phyllobacterium sp.]|uniref:glycine betaine ABC transporter substrate-binding protein n=1 Tax=Phyllobacterium sp. TaxID=1871046 RepID=UPI0030F247BD
MVRSSTRQSGSVATLSPIAPTRRIDWEIAEVDTVVTKKFSERACPAMDYLKARSWDNKTVNALLAWMTDNQATGEDGAKYFLKNQEDIWTKWVSADVAEKVKAAVK